MTNCKTKLMFALLNALLTAVFVRAHPINMTDLTNITISTGDIEIPIVPINDTLIVDTNENMEETKKPHQETVEQTNKNSKTSIDAIVNAEQGRDELILSKNNLKEQVKFLEISKEDSDSLDRQMNMSSSVLEDIIDAETGREESMTDILFKSEAEFVDDVPKFEFLIANKVNLSQAVNLVSDGNGIGKNGSDGDVLNKVDYVELVAVMPPTVISQNFSMQILNITEHEVDNDLAPDTWFTDVQTLFLACFATLVPLFIALLATLFIRCMCRRCRRCKKKSEVSSVSESSEQKQDSTTHQQLKSIPEANSDTDEDQVQEEPVAASSNGSIITMTLKNNHLIVETEERVDMPNKNGRETKLKYSPDAEGIFIVEVQQAGFYRPTNAPIASPQHDPQISTNQAIVHRVPDDSDTSETKTNESEETSDQSGKFDKARALALSSTGLSISDLSMASISPGSQSYYNTSYSYGSQTGYEQGPFGYPIYPGYEIPKEDFGNEMIHDNSKEPLICRTPTELDKPIVTSAIFKQDSIIGTDALQGPGYCIEGSSDGPLLSDVQAREVSLHQLHDKKKMGNGDANAKTPKIHRADSLPMEIELDTTKITKIDNVDSKIEMETIPEVESPVKEYIFKGKRASLPIIRTEMYDAVKEVLVPIDSPKFDVFKTDPFLDNGNGPPMITITEEVDVKTENGNSS